MKRRNKHRTAIYGTAAILCCSAPALSQTLPGTQDGFQEWQHSITPYFFLPVSTSGTSTIDGSSVDLDLDLSDVFDLLQGAASVRYEGWNGRYGIIAEGYYVRLAVDSTLPGPAATAVEVDVRQTFLSLQGGYRFSEGNNNSGRPYAADVTFGVKWNRLKQEVDLAGPGGGTVLGGTEDWFEPIVGVRYSTQISEKWTFGARAELSGFGVSGDDLQYLVLAGFDWRAWENTSLRFGYQFYGIDFSEERAGGTFAYDVDQHGPYLGLTFNF